MLKESMDPSNVLNTLEGEGILTVQDAADIKGVAPGENTGRIVEKLLDILINRKTNKDFRILLKALDDSGQGHLADELRNCL